MAKEIKQCGVCGKKIGLLTGHIVFFDGFVCTKCYERKGFNSFNSTEMALMRFRTVEDWKNGGKTEYRKKCNVCGKIFCYTQDDLHNNKVNARSAMVSAIGGVSSAIAGNQYATFEHGKAVDRAANKVIDYSKCPECGSVDLVTLTKEEFEAEKAKQKNNNSNVVSSNADEIKKYKELLDSGIITQEEFDAKKKQLLGL